MWEKKKVPLWIKKGDTSSKMNFSKIFFSQNVTMGLKKLLRVVRKSTLLNQNISRFKRVTSNVSNALSTKFIPHAYRPKSTSKVASRKQKFQNLEISFFQFFMRLVEISIHTEISGRLYDTFVTWLNTMDYALSDALSIIIIRRIQKITCTFKIPYKNTISRNFMF